MLRLEGLVSVPTAIVHIEHYPKPQALNSLVASVRLGITLLMHLPPLPLPNSVKFASKVPFQFTMACGFCFNLYHVNGAKSAP